MVGRVARMRPNVGGDRRLRSVHVVGVRSRRSADDELVEELTGGLRDRPDRMVEGFGVVRSGGAEAGNLPDVLQRGRANIGIGDSGRVRLPQCPDAPAHVVLPVGSAQQPATVGRLAPKGHAGAVGSDPYLLAQP